MDEIKRIETTFQMLNYIPVGIFVLRPDFTVLFWNNCLEDWTGLAKSDITGTDIGTHFPHLNSPRYKVRLQYIFKGGPPILFSSQLHKYIVPASLPNGQLRVQSTTVMAVPAVDNDKGFYALFSIQDVTELTRQAQNYRLMHDKAIEEVAERKRTEEELRLAKEAAETANHTKTAFLANMSHELRTPLNAILGFTQIMLHSSNITTHDKESLKIISRSGEHLLTLINDVLDMSKIEAGHTTLNENSFNLYLMLEDIENMFRLKANEKRLTLIFERATNLPRYINADEGKLRQTLINLLSNSLKFTMSGTVMLQVFISTLDREPKKSGSNKINICFKIKDTGLGISSKEMDNLFDAFTQTESGRQSQEGTGLGLPISQKFVQLMGGDIVVTSEVGIGSTFKFNIRANIVEQQRAKIEVTTPARYVVALQPKQPLYRILIVDDHSDNRKLLNKLLTPLGFELREAENGRDAINISEEWQPDFIWMDIRMPVMNGYTASKIIKSKHPDIKIVILAASSFEEEKAIIMESDCDDFLRKPFTNTDIFEMMRQHIGVQYIYEELETIEDEWKTEAKNKQFDIQIALISLPVKLLIKLEKVTTNLDMVEVNNLIKKIYIYDKVVANILAVLASDFNYERILYLVKEAIKTNQ